MDSEKIRQIVGTFQAIFGESQFKKEDKQNLAIVKALVKSANAEQKKALTNALMASHLPNDNLFPMCFFLYDMLEEVRFLDDLPDHLPEQVSPAFFYDLYWNLAGRSFVGKESHKALTDKLRSYHKSTSVKVNAFLQAYGLCNKKRVKAVRNIAILSPQLLTMRHSPTREAFSLALHLEAYFEVNAFILNTNGMAYGNQLGLIETMDFHNNHHLQGAQTKSIDYLHFKQQPVKIITFAAEPMSTRKIANIVDAMGQLQIDAVIAHGENLLVQEAVYRVFPSIFATTGGIVPFAHSDAYFVPGHLFEQQHQALAEQYQHSDFMLESMLVTPEGQADNAANRGDFAIQESDFVYLVVGTRLDGEITAEFVQVCIRLLEASEHSVIAFAGTNDFKLNNYFDQQWMDKNRVLSLGFQRDLPAISKMADVYLNPYRNGGGTSSQTAILNDLPIVTLDHGHISAVVPESFRQPGWHSYFEFALRLQTESGLLPLCQQQLKQHFVDNLDSKKQVGKILNKLKQIAAEQYQ